MAGDTPPPGGTPTNTIPKGGLYAGVVTNPTATDKDTLNTIATLGGVRWTSDAAGTKAATNITYAFPASVTDFSADASYPSAVTISSFKPLSAAQQQVALLSMAMVASYTKVTFTLAKSGLAADAALRFSQINSSGSFAYFPNSEDTRSAGDNALGANGVTPATGTFWGTDAFATILHEIGHALGLKHGHETFNGMLSADRNDSEYSHMTYATYLGAPTTNPTSVIEGSSGTSWMMYDISALQYLYGANFGAAGTTRTYTWDATTGEEKINGTTAPNSGVTATNKIISTVWDEGATSTYDLSNFTDDGLLDMRPGYYLNFSKAQIADLNSAAAPGTAAFQAKGNVYNALQFGDDMRSLIMGLKAGSGNDLITGNDAANLISAGAGDDMITGGKGNDTIDGGAGNDTAVYSIASAKAILTRNADGSIVVNAGVDGADTLINVENIKFSDTTVTATSVTTATPANNFTVANNTKGTSAPDGGTVYSGPVAGLAFQYIYTGGDNLNVTGQVKNEFIRTGNGFDAIDVSVIGGVNVLDGGTNSNFLVGGKQGNGTDTFFVDNRSPPGDIWSTVVNFHLGDAATIFGITPKGFATNWVDNEGAAGFKGLTLHVTAPGAPNASITLSGYTVADLTNGRLSQSYGTTTDNVNYLYIRGDL